MEAMSLHHGPVPVLPLRPEVEKHLRGVLDQARQPMRLLVHGLPPACGRTNGEGSGKPESWPLRRGL